MTVTLVLLNTMRNSAKELVKHLDPKNFKLVLKCKREYLELNKEYFTEIIYNSLLEFFSE